MSPISQLQIIQPMEHHEFANLFPLMSDADIAGMAQSIKETGQHDPIILFEGKILDGRNRWAACEIAGVAPITKEFTGADPLRFVLDTNLKCRRHLTESQRGMIAADASKLGEGRPKKTESIDSVNLPNRKEAAAMLNVGPATVTRGKRIRRDGSPELNAAVDSGEITIHAALGVISLPKDEQSALVAKGKAALQEAAKTLREMESPDDEPEPLVVDESSGDPAKRKSPVKVIESEGMRIWMLAKTHLDRINKHDEFRVKALTECLNYCKKRLASKK